MKPLKNADQHNVTVSRDSYTNGEYEALAGIEGVGELPFGIDPGNLHVFLESVSDLKVGIHEGYYRTIAIMKSGEAVYVEL